MNKLIFHLPPNFGDSYTVKMLFSMFHQFHGQSLQAAKQKAIGWLHPEDYKKAESAFFNNPASAAYFPNMPFTYFPIGNDKVVSTIQVSQGVMEIEGVPEPTSDLVSALVYSLTIPKKP